MNFLYSKLSLVIESKNYSMEIVHSLLACSTLSQTNFTSKKFKLLLSELFATVNKYLTKNFPSPISSSSTSSSTYSSSSLLNSYENQTLNCYSMYAANHFKPSAKYTKFALLFLRSNPNFDTISIECFGWLLPLLTHPYNTSETKQKEAKEIAIKIFDYLENSLIFRKENNEKCAEATVKATFACFYPPLQKRRTFQSDMRSDIVILNGIIQSFGSSNRLVDLLSKSLFGDLNQEISVENYKNIHESSFLSFALNSLHFLHFSAKNEKNSIALWVNGQSCGQKTIGIHENFHLKIPISFLTHSKYEKENKCEDGLGDEMEYTGKEIVLGNGKKEFNLLLKKDGKGNAFFRFSGSFLPKNLYVDRVCDRGFSISRKYDYFLFADQNVDPKEGENKYKFHRNKRVLITIDIKTTIKRSDHVMIIDWLPAAFDPENPFLKEIPFSTLHSSSSDENSFLNLPDEILLFIFSYLGKKDLLQLAITCRKFNELADDDFLWSPFLNSFKELIKGKKEFGMSTKQFYFLNSRKSTYQIDEKVNVEKIVKTKNWFHHQNIRKDRVECYVESLKEGNYQFSYIARVSKSGFYLAPPPSVQLIYEPSVCANSFTDSVLVI